MHQADATRGRREALCKAQEMTMQLYKVEEIKEKIDQVFSCLCADIAALLPDLEVHPIGATAIPDAITKGDIDVLLRVPKARFLSTTAQIASRFSIKQPENWTAEFSSFGEDDRYALPVGIQIVVEDSTEDFLLYLRDRLRDDPALLAAYNRCKQRAVGRGKEAYWEGKNAFFQVLLQGFTPKRALFVNHIAIDGAEIIIGATDGERWHWEKEDGASGADAKTHLVVLLRERGAGIAADEEIHLYCHRDDPIRPLALAGVEALAALAWQIKAQKMDEKKARELFFGRILNCFVPL
jgi:GrpB-like predicted nucleotidyltransferase (UPF0157 family)